MAETEMGPPGGTLSPSQLTSAEQLCRKMDALKRGRSKLEQDWKLNLAFYKGKQYVWWNPSTRQIESMGTEDGEKPRYRIRMVSNQILSGVQSLLAKMTKTRPSLSATPGSGSASEIKAAEMAEKLLEYWWETMDLGDKLQEAMLWSLIAGQGYWKITWDKFAGKAMKFTLGPDGSPIVDDTLKVAFEAQLQKYGVKVQEQMVYMGDIKVEPISPFNVYIDPAAKTLEEANFAFCVHNLDPDEVKARWGKDLRPNRVMAPEDATLPFDNAEDAANKDAVTVYIGYFKPTASMPKGRYVVFSDSPKQILQDEPWPYPTDDLPLVKFSGVRVPGRIYDDAIVTHARPLQKELNKTLSQIVQYKNLMTNPRWIAPAGSLRTKMTTEAGAVYEYIPIQGFKPEPEQLPSLPQYVFAHLENVRLRLNDIFGLADISEGTPPPNVEAGIAIDLLQEMATDRIAPIIRSMEHALGQAGQLMLNLAQEYYVEPRLLKIQGTGGSVQVKKFTQADIAGGIDVRAEAGSGLPRTRAGRQAYILELVKEGLIPMDKAYKHLDIADLKGVTLPFQADEDMAYREHEMLIQGEPLNPTAVQQAMMNVQQGVNPQTGEPLHGPEEAQQIIEDAALSPTLFENMSAHLDIHSLFMKSIEFRGLPPDVQQRFERHFELTRDLLMSLPSKENPAKVSLSLRAAPGPSVVRELLNKSGIPTQDEDMHEAPMETWVTDSVDKPDVDSQAPGQDGPGPDQVAQAAATMNDAALQQEAHDQKLSQDSASHLQQMRMNELKMAQDAQMHQAKLQQAKNPPRPAGR